MQYFNITSLSSRRHGFTLVELSIVLVIIGLLTGGVLAGQQLIRAAQLRAITVEKDKFVVAINAFQEKYRQYPGDIDNAYQFWGATCGTNTTTASTGCNGDGDGFIDLETTGETVKTWEHLSRAGMLEGTYDGTGTFDGTNIALSTTNSPASKFPGGYWYVGAKAEEAAPGTLSLGLYLTVGGVMGGNYYLANGFASDTGFGVTRQEAWSIDTKLDDGLADNGRVRGDMTNNCYDNIGSTGPYSVGDEPNLNDCTLTFILK